MLPDFPRTKREIHERFLWLGQLKARSRMPMLRELRSSAIHEGRSLTIVDPDGTERETSLEQFRTERTTPVDALKSMSLRESFESLVESLSEITEQQELHLIRTIDETVRVAGNAIDARGATLTIDMMMDFIDQYPLSFDDQGEPLYPTIFAGSGAMQALQRLNEDFEQDEAAQRRWQEMIERKRNEWSTREGNRALVG